MLLCLDAVVDIITGVLKFLKHLVCTALIFNSVVTEHILSAVKEVFFLKSVFLQRLSTQ